MLANLDEEYYCETCDIYCSNKFNYNKHCKTKKHLRGGVEVSYYCGLCDYGTCRLNDYNKHLTSKQHLDQVVNLQNQIDDVYIPTKHELASLLKNRIKLNKKQRVLEKSYDSYALSYKKKYIDNKGIQFGENSEQLRTYKILSAKLDEYDEAYMKYLKYQDLLNSIGDEITKKITPFNITNILQTWKNNIQSPNLQMDGKFAVLNFK